MPGASILSAAVLAILTISSLVLAAPVVSYAHTTVTHTVTATRAGEDIKAAAATPPPSSVHLAIDANFPDPSIWSENDMWYAFATNDHGRNVQVAASKDFKKWDVLNGVDALPKVGKWVNQKAPAVWAPDVIRDDFGTYVMYYSANAAGKGKHCVGAATAKNITGPYVALDKPMFCDTKKGGAIDASGFLDYADGKRYVIYKVDGNSVGHGGLCGNTKSPIQSTPLMLQPVGKDGITFAGKAVEILDRDVRDGPLVEAPSLVRTKAGKYVLFFSSNCYNTINYDIAYAVADHIAGPYTKSGPLAVTGTDWLRAPGGASIAPDGKHMTFHADGPGRGHKRFMYTAMVNIDAPKRSITW